MKFYINKNGKMLTEKQFKEKYLNNDSIKKYLLDGYFQSDFIEFCCNTVIADNVIDSFIMYRLKKDIKGNFNFEEKEIDDDEIIKALKDN